MIDEDPGSIGECFCVTMHVVLTSSKYCVHRSFPPVDSSHDMRQQDATAKYNNYGCAQDTLTPCWQCLETESHLLVLASAYFGGEVFPFLATVVGLGGTISRVRCSWTPKTW
eukprot:2944267-Amphidinium_carterae.2